MNVSGAYPVYYQGNTALRPDDGGQKPDVNLRKQQQLRQVYNRPPEEPILEGELLNKQKQAKGQAEEELSEFLSRERFRRPTAPLPQNHFAANALYEYQENQHLNGTQVIRERSSIVDVYA